MVYLAGCFNPISIHALREEGDPPHPNIKQKPKEFLSTPSARRATPAVWLDKARRLISIHALREEGDSSVSSALMASGVFLSTPSARRATQRASIHTCPLFYFYPRPPRGGRRAKVCHGKRRS